MHCKFDRQSENLSLPFSPFPFRHDDIKASEVIHKSNEITAEDGKKRGKRRWQERRNCTHTPVQVEHTQSEVKDRPNTDRGCIPTYCLVFHYFHYSDPEKASNQTFSTSFYFIFRPQCLQPESNPFYVHLSCLKHVTIKHYLWFIPCLFETLNFK